MEGGIHIISVTYHGKVKALLLELGERAYCSHLVWFETLRARPRIVDFYHTRANIDADELGNVRCERTRDLAYIHTKITSIFFIKTPCRREMGGCDTYPIHKRNPAPRWRLRLGREESLNRHRRRRCLCPCPHCGARADGAPWRAGLRIQLRTGSACQSRGPARRNGLCWLLRAGSGSGSDSALTLKWSRRRPVGAGAGVGGAPGRVGVGFVDAVLWLDSGKGRHGLELSRQKQQQQVGLLRVKSEFVPREWVPGPMVDLESLGCSVAVMVAPRWVPLYTLREIGGSRTFDEDEGCAF